MVTRLRIFIATKSFNQSGFIPKGAILEVMGSKFNMTSHNRSRVNSYKELGKQIELGLWREVTNSYSPNLLNNLWFKKILSDKTL